MEFFWTKMAISQLKLVLKFVSRCCFYIQNIHLYEPFFWKRIFMIVFSIHVLWNCTSFLCKHTFDWFLLICSKCIEFWGTFEASTSAFPCPRFLIKTAGYRRLIEKPSVKIGFSFYTLVFTDFSAISVWNLMKMFVFIKRIGL